MGIKFEENCEPVLVFVVKNNRNIEISFSLEAYENLYAKREMIRHFLETGDKQNSVSLNSNIIMCFIEFNHQRGLSLREENFHVTFLSKAAYQLLALYNSIKLTYSELMLDLNTIEAKVDKLVAIIASILKNVNKTITVEDLLQSERINKKSHVENDILAYYFDEIYQEYERRND